MSLQYALTDEFLRYTVHGDVDFSEGLEVLKNGLTAAADAPHGAPWPVVFDIRESTERRRGDELKGIAEVLGQHRGVVADRCAIVVSSPLYYELSRMFGTFTEEYGITMEIFGDLEAAEAWLRLVR
jgi:hypothetical protein